MSLMKKLPNDEKITRFWSNWHFFIIWGHFRPKTPIFGVLRVTARLHGHPVTNPKNMYEKCQKVSSQYYVPFRSYSHSKSVRVLYTPPALIRVK